jgi:hypothetical protein
MEYGDVQCRKCGKVFGVSLRFMDPRDVKVASCRVCPVGNVYAVCGNCANVAEVASSPCPNCGASHLWETQGMTPK